MKDDRKKFEEFAELAGRRKEHLLHRIGQRAKPEGQVGQVYSIPIPVARIAELEYVATARGEAPRSMLRHWVLERLDDEAPTKKGRYRAGQSPRSLVEFPHR
jgi:hypothetical protein